MENDTMGRRDFIRCMVGVMVGATGLAELVSHVGATPAVAGDPCAPVPMAAGNAEPEACSQPVVEPPKENQVRPPYIKGPGVNNPSHGGETVPGQAGRQFSPAHRFEGMSWNGAVHVIASGVRGVLYSGR